MTLTEASKLASKSVYYILVPFGLIMIGWLIIKAIQGPTNLPDKYNKPDNMCGILNEIELSTLTLSTTNTKYNIETTSGAIPSLPQIVNVFKYSHPGQSLLAKEQAQQIAEDLEFESLPERISTLEYKWEDSETARTLIVETSNLNLTLKTDFSDPIVNINSHTLPSLETAKEEALSYLQSHGLITQDYYNGSQESYPIQITPDGEYRESPSISEADLIRVDFFRSKKIVTLEEFEYGNTTDSTVETYNSTNQDEDNQYTTKVLNDTPVFGNIVVYLGGRPNNNSYSYQVMGLDVTNWLVSEQPCGTYSLISPQKAVKKVQEGEADLVYLRQQGEDRIVEYQPKSVEEMTILNVEIAYLDLKERKSYLQPIYAISGEASFTNGEYGEFYYYVPAIDYDSIPSNAGIIEVSE